MSFADVVGLIAALAFVALVGFMAVPLVKLGRVLDAATESVKEITEHTIPVTVSYTHLTLPTKRIV